MYSYEAEQSRLQRLLMEVEAEEEELEPADDEYDESNEIVYNLTPMEEDKSDQNTDTEQEISDLEEDEQRLATSLSYIGMLT